MTPWKLLEDPKLRRRLGKFGEELGELQAVISRITIQGIDEIDPGSGKTNRLRLQEEIADVMAQADLAAEQFELDISAMTDRTVEKKVQMDVWEGLLDPQYPNAYPVGALLRYADGSTALMRVESVHLSAGGYRYYGTQCMGGTVGAWDGTCSPATDEDVETWKRLRPEQRFVRVGAK